jgi:hypothetical protein
MTGVRVLATIKGDPMTDTGTIGWDGDTWHVSPSAPEYEQGLREMLDESIPLSGRVVTAETPDEFIKAMLLQYRGAGVRCVPAEV